MAINWSMWLMPVRAVQLLFALIVLGVDGSLISLYNNFNVDGYHFSLSVSQFNYVIFVALFTLIVTTYILVTTLRFPDNERLTNPYLVLGLEALSWVFWLAAWACIAALIDTAFCSVYVGNEFGCGRMKAVLAFSLLEWFLFCFTAIAAALAARSARSSGRGLRSGGAGGGFNKNGRSDVEVSGVSGGTQVGEGPHAV